MEKIGKLSFNRAQLLGAGKFGKIFVGKYKNSLDVAIKRVDKSETEIDSAVYVKANGHPNIIQYYGINNKDVEFRYLAVEICCGNLEDVVLQKYNGPKVGSTLKILRQISKGVNHLHFLGIIHGNLKPSNILVSCSKGDLKPRMKLTDFGFRHVVQKNCATGETLFRQASTKDWLCSADQENEDGQFTPPFDIFPLGNLFYYTASKGTHAFGSSLSQRTSRIRKKKPVTLDLEILDKSAQCTTFLDLVGKMLDFNAAKRPTASEIVSHEIFSKAKLDSSNQPSTSRMSMQSVLDEDQQSDKVSTESEACSSSHSRVTVKQEDFDSSEEDENSHLNKKRRIPQPLVPGKDYESSGSSSTQQSEWCGATKSKNIKPGARIVKENTLALDPLLHSIKKEKSDSDDAINMNSSFAVDQHGTSHISRRHHYDFSLERTRCSPASFHASSSSHHSQSSLDSKANDCDSKQSPNQGMANRSHPYTQFRTFQFGSCPQNFLRRRNLTNHQERVHLSPRYKCNFCHRLFQTQRLRLKHENGGRGFVGCGIRHKELNSNTNN